MDADGGSVRPPRIRLFFRALPLLLIGAAALAFSQSATARPFAATSVWNQPLAAAAPLDASSKRYVAHLRKQLRTAQPWINTTNYSTPVYTVGRGQPTTKVRLDVAGAAPDLQRTWERVPIPAHARPARGTDGHMVIHQPATDTMWEFWKARRQAGGWYARWGGTMTRVSRNPGYFQDPNHWGATATSLPLLGGLIRINELRRGRIDHALALSIPMARARDVAWPAQRTDGASSERWAIPEGTRFRIYPRIDLDKRPMLPMVRAMAKAAQKYGIVVRDQAGAVAFSAEDPGPGQPNPYHGAGGFFRGGYINNILRDQFPWESLQTLPVRRSCCWRVPEPRP